MKPRFLALGVLYPGTGFTRVLEALIAHLAQRWEIHVVGIGHTEAPLDRPGFRLHPALPGGDLFGAQALRRLARELQPEAILVYHDLWQLGRYARALESARGSSRLIAYIPLDGAIPVSERGSDLVRPLLGFDQVLVFTEWAAGEIRRALGRLGDAPAVAHPMVGVVGHGVDLDKFHPLPDLAANFDPRERAHAKRQVFPHLEADSFVVLNASRPSARKRLDLTLDGFAWFARDTPPGVRLCLHQAVRSASDRTELIERASALGLASRLELEPLGSQCLSDQDLNLLYNACDVGLSTSMGEGWGLVSCEHAAAGGAQVVPRHSACEEIWAAQRAEDATLTTDVACFLEPVSREVPAFSPLELAAVSAAGVAAALQDLQHDPQRLRELARAGWARMHEDRFRWSWVGGALERQLPGARVYSQPT